MIYKRIYIALLLICISLFTHAQQLRWADNFNKGYENEIRDIVIDSACNSYVVGYFKDTLFYKGKALMTVPDKNRGTFLMKLSRNHELVWYNLLGSSRASSILYNIKLTMSNKSNLYVTTCAADSVLITSKDGLNKLIRTSVKDENSGLVCSYDSTGVLNWVNTIAGKNITDLFSCKLNNLDQLIVIGSIIDSVGFTSTSLPVKSYKNLGVSTAGANPKAFVATYDKNGNCLWVVKSNRVNFEQARSLSIDKANNIYVGVSVAGGDTVDFNGTFFKSSYSAFSLLIKLNASGQVIWMAPLECLRQPFMSALHADDSGRVFIAFYYSFFKATLSGVSGGTMVVPFVGGNYDAGVACIDSTGRILWGKSIAGSSEDVVTDINTGADGTVLLTGMYRSNISFGNGFSTSNASSNLNGFLATFNQQTGETIGNFVAVPDGAESASSNFWSTYVSPLGEIYLTGSSGKRIVFGDSIFNTSYANLNSFVSKLKPVKGFTLRSNPPSPVCIGGNALIGPKTIPLNASLWWKRNDSLMSQYVHDTVLTGIKGNYQLIGRDACGDVDTSQLFSFYIDSVGITAGLDTTVCVGDSIQLQAKGMPQVIWSTSLWLNDSLALKPWCKPNDTLTYIVKGIKGACVKYDTITVNAFKVPLKLHAVNTLVCAGDSVKLIASGATSYLWKPATLVSDSLAATVFATPKDTTLFTVLGKSAFCSVKEEVKLNVLKVPVKAGVDTTICAGDSIQLFGTGASNYLWNPSSGLSDSNGIVTWCKPADSITYVLSGMTLGCFNRDTVKVNVIRLTPDAGMDDSICPGESIQLHGKGNGQVQWFPSQYFSDPTQLNPMVNVDATRMLYLQLSKAHCISRDSVLITVRPKYLVQAFGDTTVCSGVQQTLHATGAINYSWSPVVGLNNPTSATPIASPAITTTYVVTGSGQNCPSKDSVLITVNPTPKITMPLDLKGCTNQSYVLNATQVQGNKYQWSPGIGLNQSTILTPILTPIISTFYILTVSDSLTTCAATDSLKVVVDSVIAGFKATPLVGTVPLTVAFEDKSVNAKTWNWDFGGQGISSDASPSFAFVTPGKYRVIQMVDNLNGCIDTTGMEITVLPEPKLTVPNVFTPNEDGVNDLFEIGISNVSSFKSIQVNIMNRWGGEVAEINWPKDNWWNGTNQGDQCSSGTYFYTLKAIDIFGKVIEMKGSVMLLRE